MKNTILIGTGVALMVGILAGVQATISGKIGSLIGPTRTGIITNIFGGLVALVIVFVWWIFFSGKLEVPPSPLMLVMLASGTLGVIIIIGVSFSMSHAGVAAGFAAIIFGQMAVSLIVDSAGMGGTAPIPITPFRVAGLLVLAVGVYMLLPRS